MLTFLVDLERYSCLYACLIFFQKIKFAVWIQIQLVKLHVLFISSD